METVLILVYLLVFGTLAWRKTTWALYLITALLPTYLIRFDLWRVPLTILEGMILSLFIITLVQKKIDWLKIRQNIFFWPIIALLLIATVQIFVSKEVIGAMGIWKAYFIEPILFLMIVISNIKNNILLTRVINALGISVWYLSLIGIWQKFSAFGVPDAFLNTNGTTDRIVSVFGYPNALGLYLAPIVMLYSFWFWQKGSITSKAWRLLTVILGLSAIILAQSEGAMAAIVAIWAIALIICKKTRWWALATGFIGSIGLWFLPSIAAELVYKIGLLDYSGFIRRLIWSESWTMLKDHWLFGAGLNGYQAAIAPYHLPTFEVFMYPHNFILNFWSELGLLGLITILGLVGIFVAKNIMATKNYYHWLNFALLATIGTIFVHGLVDVPYFKNDLAVLFWLIFAIFIIHDNSVKIEKV